MITEKDEGRHPAEPGDLWNESYYFNFYDSKSKIGGFTRIGLQENLNKSNAFCMLFNDGRPAFNRFQLDLPYTEAGMDQGLTVGGLTYRVIEPLKTFHVGFWNGETELDLTWEAWHPVAHVELPKKTASAHYEQGGRVTGTVTLRGEKISFQGTGFRDHSWGMRDMSAINHHVVTWPVFGDDLVFACVQVTMLGDRTMAMGWLYDGKENLKVIEHDLQLTYEEDGITQKAVSLRLTDEKGRTWEATGTRVGGFALPYDGFRVNETMFEYRLKDGRIGYGLCEHGVRL